MQLESGINRNSKAAKILSFYFLVIFLYTTSPCDIMSVTRFTGNIFALAFPILFTAFICWRFKVNLLNKKFLYIILGLLSWNSFHLVFTEGYKVSPFPFIEVFIGYVVVQVFSYSIFQRFERLAVKLSILALLGWLLCLISYDTIYSIAKIIGSPGAMTSQSLYVFSVPSTANNGGILLRNCGFAWEPGRFSCFLLIALFINIHRTKLDFKNKNFLVLFTALITAQSTTGYLCFMLLIGLYYCFNKKINVALLTLGIITVCLILSLPFMQDKIIALFENSLRIDEQVDELIYLSYNVTDDNYYVPQRFDGMMFQLMNLQHAPIILGEGRDLTNFFLNKEMGFRVAVSEGIIVLFIQYGYIIGLLIYYQLLKSSRLISKLFEAKNSFLFFILFIAINFSYNFWENPMIISFWLFAYYKSNHFLNLKKTNLTTLRLIK